LLAMSGDGHASITFNAVRQLAETNQDLVILEKDTYLIDENNRVIPIPAGTVAIPEPDAESTAATADISPAKDVYTGHDVEMLSASMENAVEATNMPMDSVTVGTTSVVAAGSSENVVSVSSSCEIVEATSTDVNASMSLSDLYVQEEEEVMDDESKDQEAVISASGPIEDTAQLQSKDAIQKPGRKPAQRKVAKMSGEDVAGYQAKRQKGSVHIDNLTASIEKSAATITSTSPAVSTVSASGRPQRSVPRRSVYELLHGGEAKPQRRSHPSARESELEAATDDKSHQSKKPKVSKSGTADDEDHKQSEDAKVASEVGTISHVKGKRGRPPVHSTSQTSVSSEVSEATSHQCASANTTCSVSTTDIDSPNCQSFNCAPAPGDIDMVQTVDTEMKDYVCKTETDVAESQMESHKLGDHAENSSAKKQKQSKKGIQSKQDSLHTAGAVDKTASGKKVTGKKDLGSKVAKVKGRPKKQLSAVDSKGDADGDYLKVPGMPYHYFTVADNFPVSGSDNESSSDDLASEDVEWMGQRILELEQQVRRLQDHSASQDEKPTSRCWQDVLAEFHDVPLEDVDEKAMLTRYELKLRALDCELDERASYLRIREGCAARRERRILEKENKLNKKERDLEHQRCLHGKVRLSVETSASDSNTALSPGAGSTDSTRKQALEKEVRLELRKQELDRQKHVLLDERKKLAAKERELENREQALVDADLLNMASGFTASVETRGGTEVSHPNGGTTTVEFSDDDDDFGGNSFPAFNAASVSLPFSLDSSKRDSDIEETSEVSCMHCITRLLEHSSSQLFQKQHTFFCF